MVDRNVLGGELEPCGTDPLTGFYRDGCCTRGREDHGSFSICAVVNPEFLENRVLSRAPGVPVGGIPGYIPSWEDAL